MPELTGDDRQQFVDVLEDGARFDGYVVYEGRAQEAINEHLGGHSPKSLTKFTMARLNRTQDRPFPWRCGSCDQQDVYRAPTAYRTTIEYEGRPYELDIPELELPRCRNCGEVVFDNHAGHQIHRAFREKLGLLQPEEIRAGRTELDLSQKDFASLLGVAEESVSRWETDALIQSRLVDRQIRLFFELPQVRDVLGRIQRGEACGETVTK